MRRGAILALLCLLAGCGDLPQPFLGNPGATAMRLAQPPPSRLAIPMPEASLLTDAAAQSWSEALADALQAQELPAFARPATPRQDWRLVLSAEVADGSVTPTYTVLDPSGAAKGSSEGPPVSAQEWAAGQPAVLKAAAAAAAPKVVALLTGIEARREMSDPKSLLNRPPLVFLKGVTGAPGDGDTALARQMNLQLPSLGDQMQDHAKGADFTVAGEIKTAAAPADKERIEIQWIVSDASGEERGRVVQLNEVPKGSLDLYWGEVAQAVAREAAGGIHEVVIQASGRASLLKAAAEAKPAVKAAGPAGVTPAAK